MASARDSGKFIGSGASMAAAAAACGMASPVSLADLLGKTGCPHSRWIVLHLKTLTSPTIDIDTMIDRAREVYDTIGVGVVVGSREALTAGGLGAAVFNDLDAMDVANCDGGGLSANQMTLFALRNNAAANDLCLYFVTSVVKSDGTTLNGCGSHPANQPGAVISSGASRWTLAHEVGHVLDLNHISGEHAGCPATSPQCCASADFTRLMTGCSTNNITGTPTFSQDEADRVYDSPFVYG